MFNPIYSRPYDHLGQVFGDIAKNLSEDLIVRKSVAEDVLMLNVREEQKDTFDTKDPDLVIRTHAWISQLTPMHYAIFYKNELMLLVNIMPLMCGTAEISFLVDKAFVNSNRLAKVKVIRLFHICLRELPFRRVEAKVKDTFEIGRNFVEKLGMEQEGVLRKYGPSNDYIMYSLIKE
jgi:hypothetical protein